MQKQRFIYSRPDLAATFNATTSLIAGDLAYWLTHKAKRWTRRQDFADLLGLSEATIKRQGKNLASIFNVTRTMITSGTKTMPGANQYTLKPQYNRLKWSEDMQTAVTDPDSGVLPFAVDFLDIAKEANGGKASIDLAWFLCSLSKVLHNHGGHLVKFATWASLESWTQTKTRTAKRYIAQAVDAGLITVESADGLALAPTNQGRVLMLAPFVYLDNRRELRAKRNAAARMDGMIDNLSELDTADQAFEWYEDYCQRELGVSLLSYHAKKSQMVNEKGQLDLDRAHESLVGL